MSEKETDLQKGDKGLRKPQKSRNKINNKCLKSCQNVKKS